MSMVETANVSVLKVLKLNDGADAGTMSYGSLCAAGIDLATPTGETIIIEPGEFAKIKLGISIEIPDGCFGAIYPRSGLATKQGLVIKNTVGIIDSDYRGEVMVCLHNTSDYVQTIEPGSRVAQMIIQPYVKVNIVEVNSLTDTKRGNGGFGHTGVR